MLYDCYVGSYEYLYICFDDDFVLWVMLYVFVIFWISDRE